MKKKISVLIIVLLLVFCSNALAVPELKLPFPDGENYLVTQGNNSIPTHSGNLQYAWDFWRSDCEGKPVVAPVSGVVVYMYDGNGYNGGWGNTVIIDYGDGSYGKLAHLASVSVAEYQAVIQGQQIGTCGKTGDMSGPHLHYQTQNGPNTWNVSIPSSFSDVLENSGVPLEGHSYTSGNYFNPVPTPPQNLRIE